MYTIKFADGSVLSGLTLNGNNYISQTPLDSAFFTPKRLFNVTVEGEDGTAEDLGEVKLVQCVPYDTGSAFIFEPVSPEQKRMEALRADIDYILLMEGLE